tara:strand:+ start:197 stop:586 length:390 start_codon:yes stop_codon:yes gene_type:complete
MDNPGQNALGDNGSADDVTTIIKQPDEVMVRDTALYRIPGVDPRRPIVVPVDKYSMGFNVVDRAVLAVSMGMEAVPGMRRDQLQREPCGKQLVVQAFPAGDVTVYRRPFFVAKILKTRGFKFDLSRLCL